MILKDISFESPQENILYDEVLLHLAEQGRGGEVLRFWESRISFVVLGRVSRADRDVNLENVSQDNILVARRCSGGGTVLQGEGCLNYALVLSKENHPQVSDLKGSYAFILGNVIAALRGLGVESVFQPISDIALAQSRKKFSGNAQKRSRRFILHHGTLLYNFDLTRIERYLAMPEDVPDYRRNRPHLEFVTNIPVPGNAIKDGIRQVFGVKNVPLRIGDEEKRCLDLFRKNLMWSHLK